MSLPGSIQTIEDFEILMFKVACRQFSILEPVARGKDDLTLLSFPIGNPNIHRAKFEILTFLLDRDFLIESTSAIGLHPQSVYKIPFQEMIAVESKPLWSELQAKIISNPNYIGTYQITFTSPRKILRPSLCFITRLGKSGRAVVIGILINRKHELYNEPDLSRTSNHHEVLRLEELYHYIIENLENTLPSTHQLARMFGTNEFALKNGFRKMFSTSVYQFYNTEKLKRAHLYIEQSTIPLHKIASDLGFGSYGNFAKAFKKKYGYPPSKVKRWPKIDEVGD